MLASGVIVKNPSLSWNRCRCTREGALFDLSRRHVRELADRLPNLPVLVEHNAAEKVGKVLRAYAHPVSGSLYVELQLDKPLGESLRELSLRHDATYKTIWPVEVSVVEKGARDGCELHVNKTIENIMGDATAPEQSPTTSELTLDRVCSQLSDNDAKDLVDLFSRIVKDASDTKATLTQKEEALKQLQNKTKGDFGEMMATFHKFVNAFSDSAITLPPIDEELMTNVNLLRALEPIQVACSAALMRGKRVSDVTPASAPKRAKTEDPVVPRWLQSAMDKYGRSDLVKAGDVPKGMVGEGSA